MGAEGERKMICPVMSANAIPHCQTTACAWWNERFGMCCVAVPAYIKGVEDRRQELKEWKKDREYL